MSFIFHKVHRNSRIPDQCQNAAFLELDNWDDFGHKTLFTLTVIDAHGSRHSIGNIKVGYVGQGEGWTEEKMPDAFEALGDNFFSLGQDADYYRNIVEKLAADLAVNVLRALGDVAYDDARFHLAKNESVFDTSLTRFVYQTTIEHQFRRILQGEAPLTEYNFSYKKAANDRYSGIKLEFNVVPRSKPSSNIHILIGRNGVGKTTILNNMVNALLPGRVDDGEAGYFYNQPEWYPNPRLDENYFAGVVSVSFSAFDPFEPPEDQVNSNVGMRYCYVGLRKRAIEDGRIIWALKDKSELSNEFALSLANCFSLTAKVSRWLNAVKRLESDLNFADMDLCQLVEVFSADLSDNKKEFVDKSARHFWKMSSGHAIVLLTLTRLIEVIEEKTLVLIDEPESHLHPPLLSAFTRALSDLLVNRNGVAIIATHSPVVLQEVPKSSVSILRRDRLTTSVDRPEMETFGENVGILTREVFRLEVSKSGFLQLLTESAQSGASYDEITAEYGNQLGSEATSLLRGMIARRETDDGQ
jgi:predicted ATPase